MWRAVSASACFFVSTIVAIIIVCVKDAHARHVNISPNVVDITVVNFTQTLEYQVHGIDPGVSFVVFQAHTQYSNLTVSLTRTWTYGESESGSHVGVVTTLQSKQTTATFYLNASSVQNNTQIVVVATTYNTTYPIPGGCNMEFPLISDPNILSSYTPDQTVIRFEYASYNSARNQKSIGCETASDQEKLSYEVYVYYLPEKDISETTYISKVQNMLSVESIAKVGTKIRTYEYNKGRTSMRVPSFFRQGAIYGVIVQQTGLNSKTQKAAYVSSTVYPCSFTPDESENYCNNLGDTQTQIVCSVLGLFGLFLCFFGHRCFKFAVFVFGFLALGLMTYILLGRFASLDATVLLSVSGAGGLLGGILWLLLWWYIGVPVLSVLLGGLCCGFLIAAILFNLTPLGTMTIFTSSFNFGMAYTCGVLVVPVLLLAFTRTLNIVSCTMIGSYLVILVPNTWLGGTLLYIVINIYRKCVIPDFITAVLIIPVHWQETVMLIAWGLLFIGGTAFQLYREWDRPHFPLHPRKSGQGIMPRRLAVRRRSVGPPEDEAPPPYSEQEDFDERTPLLPPPRSQRRSVQANAPQPEIDHWPRQQELEVHPSNTF